MAHQVNPNLTIEPPVQTCRESLLASKHIQINGKIKNIKTASKIIHKKVSEILKRINDKIKASDNESSPSTLLTINDDCLLNIYQYLDIIEIVKLAKTCTGLYNFANALCFPMKVKSLKIEMNINDVTLLYNKSSTKLTLKNLESAFSYFGKFVENLTFEFERSLSSKIRDKIGLCHAIVLIHCHNLKALYFFDCNFTFVETYALYAHIEKLHNLKELGLFGCDGVTNNWPTTINGISKVQNLTLTANDEMTDHFFEYFRNVSNLTIEFANTFPDFDFQAPPPENKWQLTDFAMIFDHIGHCLENLKIIDCDYGVKDEIDFESIIGLITVKLLKLKCIEFEGGGQSECVSLITVMPQLKSLRLNCFEVCLNSLMSELSGTGISKLSIECGFFAEDKNAPFFNYNQLQSLALNLYNNYCNLLNALTRSNMPEIHSFAAGYIQPGDDDAFLNFVDSKKTLKTVYVSLHDLTAYQSHEFFLKIIKIFKKLTSSRRPLLKLTIFGHVAAESMDLLNANQHLIKVKEASLDLLYEL